jgi:hypothetical protein
MELSSWTYCIDIETFMLYQFLIVLSSNIITHYCSAASPFSFEGKLPLFLEGYLVITDFHRLYALPLLIKSAFTQSFTQACSCIWLSKELLSLLHTFVDSAYICYSPLSDISSYSCVTIISVVSSHYCSFSSVLAVARSLFVAYSKVPDLFLLFYVFFFLWHFYLALRA